MFERIEEKINLKLRASKKIFFCATRLAGADSARVRSSQVRVAARSPRFVSPPATLVPSLVSAPQQTLRATLRCATAMKSFLHMSRRVLVLYIPVLATAELAPDVRT